MFRPDVRHFALLGWAALNVGLVAVIGGQVGWGARLSLEVPEAEVLPVDGVDVNLLGEYALPVLEKRYAQTLERPLFVPTRRPPPPPPPPPKPTMQKGQFQLMGVMILPETSYVMLREVAGGRTRRVQLGQTINGMLVQSVEPERVVLAQYDDTEVVRMKVQPSSKEALAQGQSQVRPQGQSPAAAAVPEPGAQQAAPARRSRAREDETDPRARFRRPDRDSAGGRSFFQRRRGESQ